MTNADVMRRLRADTYTESVALRAACPPTPAADPTPVVDGYQLRIRCPRCSNPMHHVQTGRVNPELNAMSKAVVACPPCRLVLHLECRLTLPAKAAERDRMADALTDQYANADLTATIEPGTRKRRNAPDAERPPCGTRQGYIWHLNAGEDTCADCRRDNADRKNDNARRKREAC